MRTKIQSVDWTGVILDVSLIAPRRPQVHDGGVTTLLESLALVCRAGRRLLAGSRRRRSGGDVHRHATR